MLNGISVPKFVLMGFPELQEFQLLSSVIFLSIYLFVLLGNILIIILSHIDVNLQLPMNFFLINFSFPEMCYTSVTLPQLLGNPLRASFVISFWACLTQMYFFFFGSTEFLLFSAMAYDRYLAICHPLQYPVLMESHACVCLALGSWLIGFLTPFLPIAFISQLLFNNSNQINHFFCDTGPLIKLLTGNTFMPDTMVFLISAVIVLISFLLTLTSYALIVSTICHIPFVSGRHKAFSTCSSHFMVVTIFYGTVIFTYLCPHFDQSFKMGQVVSLLYTVVTLMLNPIIYILRNKDVKTAVEKVVCHVNSK